MNGNLLWIAQVEIATVAFAAFLCDWKMSIENEILYHGNYSQQNIIKRIWTNICVCARSFCARSLPMQCECDACSAHILQQWHKCIITSIVAYAQLQHIYSIIIPLVINIHSRCGFAGVRVRTFIGWLGCWFCFDLGFDHLIVINWIMIYEIACLFSTLNVYDFFSRLFVSPLFRPKINMRFINNRLHWVCSLVALRGNYCKPHWV